MESSNVQWQTPDEPQPGTGQPDQTPGPGPEHTPPADTPADTTPTPQTRTDTPADAPPAPTSTQTAADVSPPPVAGDPAPAAETARVENATPDAAPAPGADAGAGADLRAELDRMARRMQELEAQLSSGALTAAPTDEALSRKVSDQREAFAQWPQKGAEGLPTDKDGRGVQPWDLEALELPVPGKTRDFLPPGPDPISPVLISHGHGILAPGLAGPEVEELGTLLGLAGYANSISRGVNHAMAFDDTVTAAVDTFRRDYHVTEDPAQFPSQHRVEQYVGPHTWEALIRVVDRLAQQKAA